MRLYLKRNNNPSGVYLRNFIFIIYFLTIYVSAFSQFDINTFSLNWIVLTAWICFSLFSFSQNFGAYATIAIFSTFALPFFSTFGIETIFVIFHLNNIISLALFTKKRIKATLFLILITSLGIWASLITQTILTTATIYILIVANLFLSTAIKVLLNNSNLIIMRSLKKLTLTPNSWICLPVLATQTLMVFMFLKNTQIEAKVLLLDQFLINIVPLLVLYIFASLDKKSGFRIKPKYIYIVLMTSLVVLFNPLAITIVILSAFLIYLSIIESIFQVKDLRQRVNSYIMINLAIMFFHFILAQEISFLVLLLFICNIFGISIARKKIFQVVINSTPMTYKSEALHGEDQLEIFAKVMNNNSDPYKNLKYYGLAEFNVINHFDIYLIYGWRYGYSISNAVSENWYQSQLKRNSFLFPSFLWIMEDVNEDTQIMPEIDSEWMKSKYSLQSPTRHFLQKGWMRGISPNPMFEVIHSYRRPVFHSLKDAMNSITNNRFG